MVRYVVAAVAVWLIAGGAQTVAAQAVAAPACGPANEQIVSRPPVAGLCATGTASVPAGAGPWFWTCSLPGSPQRVDCAASVSAGAAPIPASRFDRYVKF